MIIIIIEMRLSQYQENKLLKKKKKKVKDQEILTGLALIDLNVGTIKTVTAKKVRVSNPKSLMTSTAPAISYATLV